VGQTPLREEDFVPAARLDGCSELRIIFRHMLPSFLSHIIASVTLAIPGVILAEPALSFLGLGLRPPVVSWACCCRTPRTSTRSRPRARSEEPALREVVPGRYAACHFAEELELRGVTE
jgi:Binding-protein-dependent transport system inner membrane component